MEDWKIKKAQKRVRKIKGFYRHLGSWAVFSVFFIILNITTSPGDFWAIFPILAWGVGVALHGIGVFGLPGLGQGWEERLMDRELERIEREEEVKEWKARKSLPDASSRILDDPEDLELRELKRDIRDSDFV